MGYALAIFAIPIFIRIIFGLAFGFMAGCPSCRQPSQFYPGLGPASSMLGGWGEVSVRVPALSLWLLCLTRKAAGDRLFPLGGADHSPLDRASSVFIQIAPRGGGVVLVGRSYLSRYSLWPFQPRLTNPCNPSTLTMSTGKGIDTFRFRSLGSSIFIFEQILTL